MIHASVDQPKKAPPLKVGDRVVEPTYGEGVVEEFVTTGHWEGKVKIKLTDGIMFHASADQLKKAPPFKVGDRVVEPTHGEGVVLEFVTNGHWEGKFKIQCTNGGVYHASASQLQTVGVDANKS